MDLKQYAINEARRHGVDPNHILPLIGTESSWNPRAVSPKGAGGLMQLMPATARDLGLSNADRFNPAKAIPAGIRYFKQQLDRFGTPELAYAAYNAGPGSVIRAGGVPNIRETQDYVRKNMAQHKPDLDVIMTDLGYSKPAVTPKSGATDLDAVMADLDYGRKPAKPPKRIVIDNTKPSKNLLDEYSLPERAIIGAGKAATDFLHGIGIGDSLGLVRGDEKADKQLMSDPAAITGNMLGQAGIMYTGGKALQTLGAGAQLLTRGRDLTKVGQLTQKGGQLLQKGGNAVINPSTYKQAALVGGGYGLVSQPGGIDQRLINASAGAAGGTAGLAFGRGLGNVGRKVKGVFTPSQKIETTLTAKLQAKGIDFNALPRAIQQQLVKAGKQSRDLGNLDTEQLARLADFEKLGIKPTRGWLTRDAKDWWTENNLNTVDSQLTARYKDANQALLEGVRDGTSQATDYDLGNRLQDTLSGYDAMLKNNVDQLYGAARNAAGRDLPLDPHRFVNNATVELDQQMLGSKLPADTLGWFQKATSGKEPFDMGTALQRLQAINGRLSSTSDMAEAKALGIVKKHLTDAIDGYGGAGNGAMPRVGGDQQQELAAAFRQARTAAADRFRFQESNPLVDEVLKGKFTPEKLPDMLGSMKVDDLKGLAALEAERGMPLLSTLRDAAKVYVRDASTLQAETGGSFTVAGLRRALDRIGPEKGKILFGADGWSQYQRILGAAGAIHNATVRPVGSPTFANFMRLVKGMGNIPIAGHPINMLVTATSTLKQMDDVARALNPRITVPVPPAAGQLSSRLPLLSVPGLLTLEEAQR